MGDYAEFSVVDKDDVLGLFSVYGLTVGVDVLELGKYAESIYINPEQTSTSHLEAPSAANVVSGLWLRTKYENTGDDTAYFSPTLLLFEV